MGQGILLLTIYSLGLAVPFLLGTVLIERLMRHRRGFGPWLPQLERISAVLIIAIGLLMVFNTTAAEIIDRSLAVSTHASLFKQITYALAGGCIGALLYAWGYENLLKYSQPLLVCATVLLALVFVPGIGMKINGARRWLGVGGVAIGQPSECVKVLLPAAYIHWFLQQRGEIDFKAFVKRLAWFAIPLGLIFLAAR